jgi:predicted permease
MLNRMIGYLLGIARRRQADTEAGEELQFHLEHEIEANLARGMSPGEARRVALRDLGGVTHTHENVRAVRTFLFDELVRDVRYGVRALVRTPRFSVVALLTIVLMVGGITTIFTLVHSVLLRPLPYPDAGRLMFVQSVKRRGSPTFTLDDIAALEKSPSFDAWGLYRVGYVERVPLANGDPLYFQDMLITPSLFQMLGFELALGRAIIDTDGKPGAPDVAVISYDLWQTAFGGTDDVLGNTIVGVTQPGTDVPTGWLAYPIVWRPVHRVDKNAIAEPFTAVARLRPGTSLDRARADLAVIADGLHAAHPDTHEWRAVTVTPLLDRVLGDFKRILWVFFGAVSCVLLIGVANLVSLQLARNGARAREIGVRAALGASRARIARQLLVESLVLCGAGGVLGLGVAWAAVQVIASTLPPNFPRQEQIGVDIGVALFAAGLSAIVGVVVGLLPARRAFAVDLASRLSDDGHGASQGVARSRMQRTLITLQTAAALVLLIGAALLGNSFYRLTSRNAGMQEKALWLAKVTLPDRYEDRAIQATFWTTSLEQVRAVRGVASAAISVNTQGPLSGNDWGTRVLADGAPATSDNLLDVSQAVISDEYFSTIGMPVISGRPISASDRLGSEKVVVINELAAGKLWPGQDALGKRLHLGGRQADLRTVVGVIPTFLHARLNDEARPQVYTSYLQQDSSDGAAILFRAAPGHDEVVAGVRLALISLEKDLDVNIAAMSDVRWKLVAPERFRTAVLAVFAVSAVFLSLVGIFGLVAYTVSQRRREIAIRVALGAMPLQIVRFAGRHALVPVSFGIVMGIGGAAMATRVLESLLIDVRPIDLPTFTVAAAALAAGAILAAFVPARQALRIDPADTLRTD